jgi:hypothetical protein
MHYSGTTADRVWRPAQTAGGSVEIGPRQVRSILRKVVMALVVVNRHRVARYLCDCLDLRRNSHDPLRGLGHLFLGIDNHPGRRIVLLNGLLLPIRRADQAAGSRAPSR